MSANTEKLKAALEARGFRQVKVWYAGINEGYMFTHVDEIGEGPEDYLGDTFDRAWRWIHPVPEDADEFPGWPGLSPPKLAQHPDGEWYQISR